MNINDIRWNPKEKKIAKLAFDKAYLREMSEIKNALVDKIKKLKDDTDVWQIQNYLSNRRDEVDKKYDYRYSQLILVFGQLLREGYLMENDLTGLDEEKINFITSLANNK